MISKTFKPSPKIDLGQSLDITINDAGRILPGISRSTLYRWSKHGIDNRAARDLLILHVEGRIIPDTRKWRGIRIVERDKMTTPSGNEMQPHQLEQYGWVLRQWFSTVDAVANINDTLDDIRALAKSRIFENHGLAGNSSKVHVVQIQAANDFMIEGK